MNNDKNNENSVKFILEMFFSFSVFFQCSKKFESLIVTEYMCTYQEKIAYFLPPLKIFLVKQSFCVFLLSPRQYNVDYKLETYLKIVRLYLEDDDPVQAEAYINRASLLQNESTNEQLQIHYKVTDELVGISFVLENPTILRCSRISDKCCCYTLEILFSFAF